MGRGYMEVISESLGKVKLADSGGCPDSNRAWLCEEWLSFLPHGSGTGCTVG